MGFTPRVFAKPSLLLWDGNAITDHNRSELSINTERIEEKQRMANGTLRKYIIADKRSFSVSWEAVPQSEDFTVDGFWGKNEIEDFWQTQVGPFPMRINYGDGTFEVVTVMFASFNASISKRGAYDFWDVDVELEEV